MMEDQLFFSTVMFLSEVWIGRLVKGSTVKWSLANSAAVTVCALVKYVCYSNKHQSHQTKQVSWFLGTRLNYPKSDCVLNETVLPRFIHASLQVICDLHCGRNMIDLKDWQILSCKSSVSQGHAQLNLKFKKSIQIHCSVDNWTLHGTKLRLGFMDAPWGWGENWGGFFWLFVWEINDWSFQSI